MKAIITGGAGFIGSHLVGFFIQKGLKVLIIDNLSSGNKKNINPKAIFKKLDINDADKTNQCFREFLPEFVVHLAAVTSKSPADTKKVFQTNILGTANILKACVKNKVKKIVFASSAAVYGQTDRLPIKENQRLSPINPYGVSKTRAEAKIRFYFQKYNLNYSILRYANAYGPGQRSDTEGGVVSIFCKKARLGKKITIYGDGRQTRDFIYIDDIIEANYLAMMSPAVFTANVSTGKETSILSLVKIMEKAEGKKMEILFRPQRETEIDRSCLDNAYIRQKLNWKPKIKIETGIMKTYKFYV